MLAIILDIDDTVYRQQQVFDSAVAQYIDVALSQRSALFKASRKHSDASFIKLQNGELTRQEMYIYRLTQAFLDIGIQLTPQQALNIQQAYAYQQQHLQLDTAIIDVLNYCKKENIILGIITNGGSRQQWDKIHCLGLLQWVPKEAIIVSEDVGIIKPHSQIFKLLEQRLNLVPEQTYYIGDAFHNDVIGALDAGWQSIWLNQYDLSMNNKNYQPHFTIQERSELLSLVKKLCR